MVIAIIPVLVLIVGLLVWVLAARPKAAEAGRILFAVGALITVYVLAHHTIKIG